ncbi:MAG: cysteine--tRNA ligase, partial [Alistipes sp.]|nr:cysteine--tRNA ligase [Alistipes sp.]
THPKLEQAYSPMTIRFFILQAHYRSTLDFSNAALQAAEKGFDRLMKGVETLGKLKASAATSEGISVAELEKRCAEAMNDDLNSPMVISALFDYVRFINQIAEGQAAISEADLQELRRIYNLYVFDILGLRNEKQESAAGGGDMLAKVVDMILAVRQDAKANKDWATSDKIRNELTAIGIRVKDRKDGVDWEIE